MVTGEDSPEQAGVSVAWLGAAPEQGDASLERAAVYASVLARTLATLGYQPRQLSVGIGRERVGGVLHLIVHGDVPGISGTDFESLARATLTGAGGPPGFAHEEDLVLEARLAALAPAALHPASATPRAVTAPTRNWALISRFAVPLVLGLLLGVVGLPRLELPFPSLPLPAERVNPTAVVPTQAVPATLRPPEPTALAATPVPQTSVISKPSVLLAEQFGTPVARWPNDPRGTAWFGSGEYRLLARDPGRFVAVGVPLPQAERQMKLGAQFRKTGGPSGGGYGFILRDQGSVSDRDGHNQAGQYMVVEVGDRGDVGVWQRDETHWIDIVPWTHSGAVHTDREANVLTATTAGSSLQFEVNGTLVADLTYDRLPPTGGVGIFVGGDLNEVALDWLRIEAP